MKYEDKAKLPGMPRKLLAMLIGLVLLFVLLIVSFSLFENLDARQIMVIQSPIKGKLTWYTTPGVKWQGFGKVTKYTKRDQFWFSQMTDQGKKHDESIKVRFNDAGHALISGSIAWEMPIDEKNLTALHIKYGSHFAVEQQLVRTILEKAIYMTGPLMSSTESYAEKRNELLSLIEDQVQRGVYRTETFQEKKPDPVTGVIKTVNVVKLAMDKQGLPMRAETSPLTDFGIKTFNLAINEVRYDKQVEEQIQQQQRAIMQVQIALAQAKEAEQKAITVGKEGEANAAKAKWEQAVTEGEQRMKVAELDMKAAEMKKKELILLGEGEGTRRKLVMEADGALAQKLDTYLEANKVWADAAAKYQGNWVPMFMSGGSGVQAGSGVQQFMDLFTLKLAKESRTSTSKVIK